MKLAHRRTNPKIRIVFWGRLDAECIRERFLEKQSEIRLRS